MVLLERRRADALHLAARQQGLQDVGRVDRAFGRARADDGVELVDEEYDVARFADLRHGVFQPFLKFAAYFAPASMPQGRGRHALAAQYLRDAALDDELRQPLDDGGLAHARLADEHGVVLRAPGEYLHDALDLPRAADDGVELAGLRRLGQVAGKLVERGGLLLLRGSAGSRFLAAAEGRAKAPRAPCSDPCPF